MNHQITEAEKDILQEILNVGISKAADAFSRLIRCPQAISLSVPEVKIIDPDGHVPGFQDYHQTVLAVKTRLQGDLTGITLLLFNQEHTAWIMSHCLSDREQLQGDQLALRTGLLMEMSNILSGAVITQLTDLLDLNAVGLPPESITTEEGQAINDLLCHVPPCQPIVLSVRTGFTDRQKSIDLPLLLALENSSLECMLSLIRKGTVQGHPLLRQPASLQKQ